MRKTWAVAQKELVSYFSSPVAYVIMAVFFLIVSYFFVVHAVGKPSGGTGIFVWQHEYHRSVHGTVFDDAPLF